MKKRLHEILNTQISRRETVTTAAKIGSAVALSNAISLPFSSSALAAPEAATVNSGETVRHSACLVNCGSRCALKTIASCVSNPKTRLMMRYLANTRFAPVYAGAPIAGACTARIALNIP